MMPEVGRTCSTHEMITSYKMLIGTPEGKR